MTSRYVWRLKFDFIGVEGATIGYGTELSVIARSVAEAKAKVTDMADDILSDFNKPTNVRLTIQKCFEKTEELPKL